ncbi:MAG: aldo/keto reductase [Vicinamibacteria bacterium]|nr:aldo/keto reductase [Vicinamibacteria bacterium]
MPGPSLTRRDILAAGAALVPVALSAQPPGNPSLPGTLERSVIPSSGRLLARVGLGTWQTFDVGADKARRAALAEVLQVFTAAGADVVDTSPMYGTSEAVLGDLLRDTGLRPRVFLATKVWTQGGAAGIAQMKESRRLLRSDRLELMQIHNLVDWRVHLKELRRMKDAGLVSHIGVTHYTANAIDELISVVRAEKLDFVQFALSLEEPEAADRLLGLCQDRGVAFLANRPFGGGRAFGQARGQALPPWAGEIGIGSWAQFLLKWVLSFPQVTCAIPGTGKAEHMRDNLRAAVGPAPDAATRARMSALWKGFTR